MDNSIPSSQHVVILRAGPAGAGAAYQLVRKGIARVTVLEQQGRVGGNAGSFDLDGIHCDFGSHRLHPAASAEIMDDLRRLLGGDLLYQTRHGSILLHGRWIHFPLKPLDLFLRLPKSFALGVMADMARKLMPRGAGSPETFATVLERGLGRTICQEFYFPYARKLWGIDPGELAVTTARKRVSGSSIGKILRKVSKQIPGFSPPGPAGSITRGGGTARSPNACMRRPATPARNSSSELVSPGSSERGAASKRSVTNSALRTLPAPGNFKPSGHIHSLGGLGLRSSKFTLPAKPSDIISGRLFSGFHAMQRKELRRGHDT